MEGRGEGGNGGIPNGENEVSPWKHNRGGGGESSSARQGKKRFMRHTRVIVTHYGGPDALRVVEEECPEPKDGEVRVRVLAAGGSFHLEDGGRETRGDSSRLFAAVEILKGNTASSRVTLIANSGFGAYMMASGIGALLI